MARRDMERVGVVVAVTAAAKTQKWPQLPYQTCPYIHKYIHRVYTHMYVCLCVCALTADYIEIQAAFAFAQLLKMVWHIHTHTHTHT